MASIRTVEYRPSRKVHAAPGFNLTLCGCLATGAGSESGQWVEVAGHSSPEVVTCERCRASLRKDGELPEPQHHKGEQG